MCKKWLLALQILSLFTQARTLIKENRAGLTLADISIISIVVTKYTSVDINFLQDHQQ